jgi:hypothetical protein
MELTHGLKEECRILLTANWLVSQVTASSTINFLVMTLRLTSFGTSYWDLTSATLWCLLQPTVRASKRVIRASYQDTLTPSSNWLSSATKEVRSVCSSAATPGVKANGRETGPTSHHFGLRILKRASKLRTSTMDVFTFLCKTIWRSSWRLTSALSATSRSINIQVPS